MSLQSRESEGGRGRGRECRGEGEGGSEEGRGRGRVEEGGDRKAVREGGKKGEKGKEGRIVKDSIRVSLPYLLSITLQSCLQNCRFFSKGVKISPSSSSSLASVLLHVR